jgi:glycosyltransferase involved in cell wall biosynthesis
MNPFPKILIFSPSASGGIAEHTFYQARALEKAGAKVVCLVPPSFSGGRNTDFETIPCLPDPVEGASGLMKKLRMAWGIISSQYVLAWQIIKHRPDLVLLDSYLEYLAPLWVDPHIILSRIFGVRYVANLHDPVRSYAIGPKWWHKLSVWLAYQPLNFVLVHHELPERSVVPKLVKVVVAPHGLYDVNLGDYDSKQVREGWGIQPGQKVFLSFGYVRDGKNLDLAIKALAEVPEVVLVVAGSVASTNDRPFSFYRGLADEVGVTERCRFFEGFVSEEEMGRYFAGIDFMLLTYSASFHSQSGVLNVAAKAHKPVLASASPSPMIEAVTRFGLGVAVKPDSVEAIVDGMKKLCEGEMSPDWEGYEASASWDLNARRVLEAAGLKANNNP